MIGGKMKKRTLNLLIVLALMSVIALCMVSCSMEVGDDDPAPNVDSNGGDDTTDDVVDVPSEDDDKTPSNPNDDDNNPSTPGDPGFTVDPADPSQPNEPSTPTDPEEPTEPENPLPDGYRFTDFDEEMKQKYRDTVGLVPPFMPTNNFGIVDYAFTYTGLEMSVECYDDADYEAYLREYSDYQLIAEINDSQNRKVYAFKSGNTYVDVRKGYVYGDVSFIIVNTYIATYDFPQVYWQWGSMPDIMGGDIERYQDGYEEFRPNDGDIITIETFYLRFNSYSVMSCEIEGVVYAYDKQGLYLTDDTGKTLYVGCSYENVKIGQTVNVKGRGTSANNMPGLEATDIEYGEIDNEYNINPIQKTIFDLTADYEQHEHIIIEHNVYRTSGVVTAKGSKYYLVDGDSALLLREQTTAPDYKAILSLIGREITLNVVIANRRTDRATMTFSPLCEDYSNVDVGTPEPEIIETNVLSLINNPPLESMSNVYEITGLWYVGANGGDNGFGWIRDEEGNEITVMGLSASYSSIVWTGEEYVFTNDYSYFSLSLEDDTMITVELVCDSAHNIYYGRVIEILEQ